LDPENPRIPPRGQPLSQRDLIAELVEHDKVYELAKEIVEQGYYPIEAIVCLRDGKAAYVLEGNRRVTALKLLGNPDLAPSSHLSKCKSLAEQWSPKSGMKIRVLWAPTREAAAPLIMLRHTRSQIEAWSPIMQARFYAGLRKEGITIAELAKQYGVPQANILEALRLDRTYSVACAMDLPPQTADIVRKPREFRGYTVLERLLNSPKPRKFLGMSFDADGVIRGQVD